MSVKQFPFKIEDIDEEQSKIIKDHFKSQTSGFVKVGPKGYCLRRQYKDEAATIYNMEIKPSDVFLTGYPRSGTTWTQELVWMVATDLDYATSTTVPLTKRFPFLEYGIIVHPDLKKKFISENSHDETKLALVNFLCQSVTEKLAGLSSPRFIKSHMPLSLLNPDLLETAKMVYVARDPRDVVVSLYHLTQQWKLAEFVGDLKSFWNIFIKDLYSWNPYFEHVKEAWEQRNHRNMLFIFYEDLKKDLRSAVLRMANFFGKKFSEDQINRLCEHLSIENFKKNKSVNYDILKETGFFISDDHTFIRRGKTGGWRDYFDEEMTQQAERWIADNLRDTDLRFPSMTD